jgi:hypothetical protein
MDMATGISSNTVLIFQSPELITKNYEPVWPLDKR